MSSSTSNSDSPENARLVDKHVSDPTSNLARLRRFAGRFALFCLPMLALWLPLEWFLWQTGENLPATSVLALQSQSDHEVLYGRGLLNQQFNVYKIAAWRKFRPSIVAVGSSRVWRLRKAAFHPREQDFYNAGGMLQCADDFREMVEMIADGRLPKPEALIVGFDPWWFKANHPNRTWLDPSSLTDDAYNLAARRNVIKRLIADPSPLSGRDDNPNVIGIYGNIGFRLDGSMKVGDTVIDSFQENPIYVDRETPPVIERIANRTGRFSDSEFDEETLATTITSIRSLRQNDVLVFAFFPPFANESWEACKRSNAIMRWMRPYLDTVIPEISAAANHVIPFGDSRSLGVDDTYFLDGMHAGEVLSTLQWIQLVEQQQEQAFFGQFAPQYVRQQLQEKCETPLAYD